LKTGDQTLIKHLNRKIILETIIHHKSISRAQLSKLTGLNKATITSQIVELINDGLVVETVFDKSSGGRKPLLLSLNHCAGYAIGIELDVDCIYIIVTDLSGRIVNKKYMNVNTSSYERTKKVLCEQIRFIIKNIPVSRYGIVGIGIGIHGIVDKNEQIVFATHSNWRNVDLKSELLEEFHLPVHIDNNTNLIASAEKAYYADAKNLLCLTVSTGIGLGIIIDHEIFRGFNGFAGEVGHMITHIGGLPCSCGNNGCWEKYASEQVFLSRLAEIKHIPSCTVEDVQRWVGEKDQESIELFAQFSKELAIGLNNIINTFNPETIIINSELIGAYPQIIEDIKRHMVSSMSDYGNILHSKLGKKACALGASIEMIKRFLNISQLQLSH